jgi:flagellar protein FliO/FliZ
VTRRAPLCAGIAALSTAAYSHASAAADSATTATVTPDAARPLDIAPGLLQTTLGLALVVAVILALAWMARRVRSVGHPAALIKIVAAQTLGPRERVVLIEIGEQWLLLGVAPGAVRTLHTLPKGTVPSAGVESPFARLLASARTRRPQ